MKTLELNWVMISSDILMISLLKDMVEFVYFRLRLLSSEADLPLKHSHLVIKRSTQRTDITTNVLIVVVCWTFIIRTSVQASRMR
jgi:hypothetical protein